MGMTLQEMDEARQRTMKATPEVQGEVLPDEGLEQLQREDMLASIDIHTKCMHFLACLADKDTCKALSQRERDVAFNLSEIVRVFLDNTVDNYQEE